MKVLIAIDDSPHSRRLIDVVCSRHWAQDTQFKIVAVLEPFSDEYLTPEWFEVVECALARRKEHTEELCQTYRQTIMKSLPGCNAHYEIRKGDPRIELVNAAAEWPADKMVLGAHARDVCLDSLLGSVSRAVAAHSPCSVEIVRTKEKIAAGAV